MSERHEDLASDGADRPVDRLTARAERYLDVAADRPGDIAGDIDRIVELLSADAPSVARGRRRRAAAAGALAAVARDHPARASGSVPAVVEALRAELDRPTAGDGDRGGRSRAVRRRLVSTLAHVVAEDPGVAEGTEVTATIVEALSTDLDDGTVRAATTALFAVARDRPARLVSHVDALGELAAHPDDGVRALSVATLGRLAESRPDAVAPVAGALWDRLVDDGSVQHNAVEALATLAGSRPDAVAPAAADLRELLGHEAVPIQHNAAGALGRLAADHPDAVRPAVADLDALRSHDDQAVRRVATAALARLARHDSD